MYCAKITANSAKKTSERLRYLLVTEAAKAVAWTGAQRLDELPAYFRTASHDRSVIVWSCVVSFADELERPESLTQARTTITGMMHERLCSMLKVEAPTLIVFHGPPVERTALHAHVMFVTTAVPEQRVRNALQPQRPNLRDGAQHYAATASTLPYQTLYEWLHEQRPASWTAWLDGIRDRPEFEQRLWDEYGLQYRDADQGAVIEEPRSGTFIRPSKVDPSLAGPAIAMRFGSAPATPNTTRDPSRVYDRRLRAHISDSDITRHEDARAQFHASVLPARRRALAQARERYLQRCAQVQAARREQLDAAEIERGRRRAARAALRAQADGELMRARAEYRAERDEILRRFPRPDPNIQRWLRDQQRPEPPALIGGRSMPAAPWTLDRQEDGRIGLVHDGIRYATIERDGRLLIADRNMPDALLRALPESEAVTGDRTLCAEVQARLRAVGRDVPHEESAAAEEPARTRARTRGR